MKSNMAYWQNMLWHNLKKKVTHTAVTWSDTHNVSGVDWLGASSFKYADLSLREWVWACVFLLKLFSLEWLCDIFVQLVGFMCRFMFWTLLRNIPFGANDLA